MFGAVEEEESKYSTSLISTKSSVELLQLHPVHAADTDLNKNIHSVLSFNFKIHVQEVKSVDSSTNVPVLSHFLAVVGN